MKKKLLLFNIIAVNFILLTACNTGVAQKSDKIEINSDYDILSMCNVKEGYDVTIKKDNIDISKTGDYDVVIDVSKNGKNNEQTLKFKVQDTQAPKVESSSARVKINATEDDLKKYVKVTDNSKEEIEPVFDMSKVDTTKPGEYSVPYTVKDSAGNKTDDVLKIEVTNYQTTYSLTDMNEQIKKLIDEKYSDVFTCYDDEYTDNMSIEFSDINSVTCLSNDNVDKYKYQIYVYPYMKTCERNDYGMLLMGITFDYYSGNFLDYYKQKMPVIFLNSEGNKMTYDFLVKKTDNKDNINITNTYFILNKKDENTYSDYNVDNIYNLFSVSGMSYRINKTNSKKIYPEGTISDEFSQGICKMIDFYKDVEDVLDWKPEANYK